jgi:hypothetical protein
MISPHPMHKTVWGICSDCHNENLEMVANAMGIKDVPEYMKAPADPVIDGGRPRMRGRHMVIKRTQAEIEIERRRKERGHIARY